MDILTAQERTRAALDAYSEVAAERAGRTFTNGDHRRAMEAAIEAADRLGGPYLARVKQVEKKLSNLRGIATAAQSQLQMVLSELGNVERAVGKIRPSKTPPCPNGCGPTDRILSHDPATGGPVLINYRCSNCQTSLSIDLDEDPALQDPQ